MPSPVHSSRTLQSGGKGTSVGGEISARESGRCRGRPGPADGVVEGTTISLSKAYEVHTQPELWGSGKKKRRCIL